MAPTSASTGTTATPSHDLAPRDVSSVSIALGVVALLLVPSVLIVVDDAEDWGRSCALDPTNPDC